MNYRKFLIIISIFVLVAAAFLLGSKFANTGQATESRHHENAVELRGNKMGAQPKQDLSNSTLFPAVIRKPAKLFITHQGPSYGVHMQLMTNQLVGVSLTDEQIAQLQDVYNALYEARLDYELSIASVGVISDRESLIEIPSFPEFGEKLKKTEFSMFEDILGKDLAQNIIGQLSQSIDGWNQYWGKYPQSILASYNPSTKEYKITLTVNPSPKGADGFQSSMDGVTVVDHLDMYSKFRPLLPRPH